MRSAKKGFLERPGVTFKKQTVRTPAQVFQELQVRNYASFVAAFDAFAHSPAFYIRLLPNQFAMMDMVGSKWKHPLINLRSRSIRPRALWAFEERMPYFLRYVMPFFFWECGGTGHTDCG
jgi:hypothetical protein